MQSKSKIAIVFILIGLILSITFSPRSLLFAQTEVAESDREAIRRILEDLSDAIVNEDIDSIIGSLSPNIDREEQRKIKETLKKRFTDYDYTEYEFDLPPSYKIEVLEPNRKVKFKTRYSEEYKFDTWGSGSTRGMSSNFTLEKIDGKWLILSTDFYTKERAMKAAAVIAGLFFLLCIASFIFWLWMLIDCIKRDFPKPNDKIIWILLIIFTQIIGVIIYYLLVKRKSD